jgi:hypothetical protein
MPSPVALRQPESATVLPKDGAQPTVESALAAPTPLQLDTLDALDRHFSTATAADLAAQWQQAVYTNPVAGNAETRLTVLKLLLARWASKDGSQAAAAVLKLPAEHPLQVAALPLVLEAWARNQPAEAAKWYLDEKQKSLRELQTFQGRKFTHEAFEGLYAVDPLEAIRGLEKLSSTAEIVNAVDGILHAGTRLGESPFRFLSPFAWQDRPLGT